MRNDDLENVEIDLLLEGVYRRYGYDFREYARGSLNRRIRRRVEAEGVGSVSALQEKILRQPAALDRLVLDLSINVTAMYRDPSFYLALRTKVIPTLRTYPFLRVWNAGCSTGEETYSLAILLQEEGLYERTRIYATDINQGVLALAERRVFPLDKMREYTENYIKAGGRKAFSEYYSAAPDGAKFREDLTTNVVFAQHNLVSDRSFNEFNLIMCRNVMIYFDKALQNHVHDLFHKSLVNFGILTLGRKESIKFTTYEDCYEELDPQERIYRKVK
ncbi:MAG: protein-glutamate O-methyltransferase CheR [Actinomycetota bacterium]|nr:protein-glutamate O-methyltransferase CheR [Actinomycetota bacterium]